MRILITGGAGFIGSAVVRHLMRATDHSVLVVDKLTYAGNLASLREVQGSAHYNFCQADICDRARVTDLFASFEPHAVMHLAAESHVDRSIDAPAEFVNTNVVGTYTMLDIACSYWSKLDRSRASRFLFHHISTDEVFGSLKDEGYFTEGSAYDPRSPYSATKAASDHLVRAWGHTYGLPILITNCSNNYGPYQFPEKLIPLMIIKGLAGEAMPVYGQGLNVRDWLYVEDHAEALTLLVEQGRAGETYNIGGAAERRNIDVVNAICDAMDELVPRPSGASYREQINFVADRPGHDFRYAIDFSKLKQELGWSPRNSFESGLRATVKWYLANRASWEPLLSDDAAVRRGLAKVSA